MTDGPLHPSYGHDPSYGDGVVINNVVLAPAKKAARAKTLLYQIVVRLPPDLVKALRQDADDNGRTIAQSVRFHLTRALQPKDPS